VVVELLSLEVAHWCPWRPFFKFYFSSSKLCTWPVEVFLSLCCLLLKLRICLLSNPLKLHTSLGALHCLGFDVVFVVYAILIYLLSFLQNQSRILDLISACSFHL
jgi:hypothetical protein